MFAIHKLRLFAPVPDVFKPCGQFLHGVSPGMSLYVLIGQGMHVFEVMFKYRPLLQDIGVVVFLTEKK